MLPNNLHHSQAASDVCDNSQAAAMGYCNSKTSNNHMIAKWTSRTKWNEKVISNKLHKKNQYTF